MMAVRDRVRKSLGVEEQHCRVVGNDQGKPPAFSGNHFVAVHAGDWRGVPVEGLGESFGARVTVTLRTSHVPDEALGEEAWLKEVEGLEAILRQVLTAVVSDVGTADNPTVLNRANAILGGDVNGFVEKLQLQSGGTPQEKSAMP